MMQDVPKIEDPPLATIFLIKPPPSVSLSASTHELQMEVAEKFDIFHWPQAQAGATSQCNLPKPDHLNLVQQLCMHYMQPYNENVNVLLNHSAGSGKTCTAMLIASVFARANYTPVIVTKGSLKDIPLYDAFKSGCDVNIQQYMASKGEKFSFPNMFDMKNMSPKEQNDHVKTQGIRVWRRMGIPFQEDLNIMTYQAFSNIARGRGNQQRLALFAKNSKNLKDPIANTIIIIDEAHKLVARSTDLLEHEQGDYFALLELLHRSYELSGEHAARVVLLTATPIADSPIDIILLMNLINPDHMIDLTGGVKLRGSWLKKKSIMEANFYQHFWKKNGGELLHMRRIQRLMNGRISYFNYNGDPNRFAMPKVEWLDFQMTAPQLVGIDKCFKEYSNVRYFPRQNKWLPGKPGLHTKNLKSDILKAVITDEKISTPKKSKHDVIEKNIEIEKRKSLANCVRSNLIWPKQQHIKQYLNSTKAIKPEDLKKKSELFAAVMEMVEKQQASKQMIFTDLSFGTLGDYYGVTLIGKMLERLYGYKIINQRIEGKEGFDLVTAPPHKGVIVLGSGSWMRPSDIRVLKNLWNSAENKDGKKASIIVLAGKYKEGISLFGISVIHVVGLIESSADLKQAVARGIRNCSAKSLYFTPYKGWTIKIFIYSPKFNASTNYTPLSMLKMITDVDENALRVMDQLQTLMEQTAYDRALLKHINKKSQAISDMLKLPN